MTSSQLHYIQIGRSPGQYRTSEDSELVADMLIEIAFQLALQNENAGIPSAIMKTGFLE